MLTRKYQHYQRFLNNNLIIRKISLKISHDWNQSFLHVDLHLSSLESLIHIRLEGIQDIIKMINKIDETQIRLNI